MKIGTKVEEALNQQINKEIYSGYLYMAMAAYFDGKNLPGLAHWMREQAHEEQEHAMKFYRYIVERQGRVELKAIEAPPVEWKSPLEVFEAAYKHEVYVTSMIDSLVDLAVAENDKATQVFLNWFVDEQVEEEATADGIVQQLKMIKDSANGLFMLDRALARRGEK